MSRSTLAIPYINQFARKKKDMTRSVSDKNKEAKEQRKKKEVADEGIANNKKI